MQVIYLNTGLSSVFESQVLDLLILLKSTSEVEQVYLCCGYVNRTERCSFKKLTDRLPIETTFFRSFPNIPIFNTLNRLTLQKAIACLPVKRKDIVIHIRGELLAYYLSKVLKPFKFPINHVLIDIRGAALEEIIEYTKFQNLIRKRKVLNYTHAINSLRSYAYINAISPALKEYIIEKTQINPENISVISNLAGNQFRFSEEKRNLIRQELHLKSDEVLFVFSSGGTGLWQKNQAIIELADKGLKVLNLSKTLFSHKNILNRYIAFKDVPDYLSAADIAVILRDKSIVNEVASPAKFSEFICSGLPVVSTKSIRMISDYISLTGYGVIIEKIDEVTTTVIKRLMKFSRTEIEKYGQKYFGVDTISNSYLNQYQTMLNNANIDSLQRKR